MQSSTTSKARKGLEHGSKSAESRMAREQAYARGFRVFKQGRYRHALDHFTDLLRVEPANPRYLAAAGACFQRLNRYEDALRQYALSLLLSPGQRLCQLYSAQCLLALGRTADAAKALSLLLKTPATATPSCAQAHGYEQALEAHARAMLDAIERTVDQAQTAVEPS
jgi:predicted Zn-dependent protease